MVISIRSAGDVAHLGKVLGLSAGTAHHIWRKPIRDQVVRHRGAVPGPGGADAGDMRGRKLGNSGV